MATSPACAALERSLAVFTSAKGADGQEMSQKAEEATGTVLVRKGPLLADLGRVPEGESVAREASGRAEGILMAALGW